MGKDRDDDDDARFERKDYEGPGELTSALGEGAKGAAVWGGVGAGIGAAAHQLESVREFGEAYKVGNKAANKTFLRAAKAAQPGNGSQFFDTMGRAIQSSRKAVEYADITIPKSTIKSTGRAALITGGVLATVGTVTGMASGWGRASETRKSWTERENERSAMAAQLQR